MKSQLIELKPIARAMRQRGKSLALIESALDVPRSTLHGWCKDIQLTAEQKAVIKCRQLEALAKARLLASEKHRDAKKQRLLAAQLAAAKTMSELPQNNAILELALAMLYWGEGKKSQTTALGSSDPEMIAFFVKSLRTLYSVNDASFTCELHLRDDQKPEVEIDFWQSVLHLPRASFKRVFHDKRTNGRNTFADYHGVCLVYCSNIAIQRKLVYLYKLFCDKV